MSAIRQSKKRNNPPKINRLDSKRTKKRRKRRKLNKVARRLAFKLASKLSKDENDNRISEDDCDFDFDNSGRALCSTSEDDSDGPQGEDP